MNELLKQLSVWKEVQSVEVAGKTLYVRTGDAHWLGRWSKACVSTKDDPEGDTKLRTIMLAGTLCDAEGVLLFKDEAESEQFVRETAAIIVDKLYLAASEINEIGQKKSKN